MKVDEMQLIETTVGNTEQQPKGSISAGSCVIRRGQLVIQEWS